MKRGFYIPTEIWDNPNLMLQEKFILAEIYSFRKSGKECYISNARVAEILGLEDRQAREILYGLIRKRVVVQTKFDGKRRFLDFVEGWQENAKQGGGVPPCRVAEKRQAVWRNSAKQGGSVAPQTIKESTDKNIPEKNKRKVFSVPSVEDVMAYAESIGHPEFNANKFINYYDSKAWKVGKSPMKDWNAAVRNWILMDEEREKERSEGRATSYSKTVLNGKLR